MYKYLKEKKKKEMSGHEKGEKTPKSSNNHHSQVTSAITRVIALNSSSALERETATYFLVFQAMREPPRKTQ